MRTLFNFGINQGLLPQAENLFNGAVVHPGTKKGEDDEAGANGCDVPLDGTVSGN
jgi:hypothetical protein